MLRTVLAVACFDVAQSGSSVLVIGDSWGDTGPTYQVIGDAFKANGVVANVSNRAIGGTTACQWAAKTKSDKTNAEFNAGQALINAAQEEFGADGPEFVWYTLGGNDLAFDDTYHSCLSAASSTEDAHACVKASSDKAKACTKQLFDPFFAAFPKMKLMQCNYDVPCESLLCDAIIVNDFLGGNFCKGNKLCMNSLAVYWAEIYTKQLQKEYAQPQYTALDIFGTVQQANGISGASPGNPVLNQDSGSCGEEVLCIHPKYGSKMATAVGNVFWDMFFSKYVSPTVALV
jgi:hypothetical protein